MIIDFTRTGGVGGMKLSVRIDTADLLPDEAAEITKSISKLKIERIKTTGADNFIYTIKITNGEAVRTLRIAETPENAGLIRYLTIKAKGDQHH